MPTLHQEPDDRGVIGKIKEVLAQRIGTDRFGLWFGDRVRFAFEDDALVLRIDGEFALERLRGTYFRAVESAAAETLGRVIPVRLELRQTDPAMLSLNGRGGTAPAPSPAAAANGRMVNGKPVDCDDVDVATAAADLVRPSSSARKSPAGRRGSSATGASRTHRSQGGLAPVSDWLMAAATDPKHSEGRAGSSSNSHARTSARGISHPRATDLTPDGRPGQSAAMRLAADGRAIKSIRVTADPDAASVADNGAATSGGGVGQPRRSSGTAAADQGQGRQRGMPMTFGSFVRGNSNSLAATAAELLAAEPAGATPLCFWGATGTGKTHLLSAIRHELRSRMRMPRVILMSAEEFTNDFLSCVRGTGLPAFRKRYRDVDALLIDNVQFLGGKTATLREMLYTVDTVLSRGRPLVLAADRQPLEIDGLSGELAGRMSSGLVCGINPMEPQLRRELYRRHAQRSFLPWDEATIEMLAERTVGDGRVIQGISQLVSMLQRMFRRMPTEQEIMAHAGDMLQRGPKAVALADVERAICTAFGLSATELRSESKSRSVSQPRILAMYLSRQLTTAAYAEIGRYYGDRNHSTVIAAHRRVEGWLQNGSAVGGRGSQHMKVHDAIAAVENLLRIG